MTRRVWSVAQLLALGLLVSANAAGGESAAHQEQCGPQRQEAVVEIITQMFSSLAEGDDRKLGTIVTPDFYVFDAGRRFDQSSLAETIRSAKKTGTRFKWNVTDPEVQVGCHVAWITYINRGEVTHNEKVEPATWLESAILREQKGRWLIAFLHSTPVHAR